MSVVAQTARIGKAASASGVVLAFAATIALLYFGRVFLITLCTATILAFILDPFVGLLMRLRLPRAPASFLVCSVAICVVYLLGLGVYTQTTGLVQDLPMYRQRINQLTEELMAKAETMERAVADLVVPKRLRERQPEPVQPAKPPARGRRAVPAPPPEPAGPQEVVIRTETPPLLDFLYENLGSLYEAVLMGAASCISFTTKRGWWRPTAWLGLAAWCGRSWWATSSWA